MLPDFKVNQENGSKQCIKGRNTREARHTLVKLIYTDEVIAKIAEHCQKIQIEVV